MVTKKKVVAKKPVKSKVTAKRAVAPKRTMTAIRTKLTKSQIVTEIATQTDLTRKEVGAVLEELTHLVDRSIRKRAVGEFTLPGLLKVITVKKPAKKARKGINPFTSEEQMFKAKPASIAVKVRPLKKLKDFVTT